MITGYTGPLINQSDCRAVVEALIREDVAGVPRGPTLPDNQTRTLRQKSRWNLFPLQLRRAVQILVVALDGVMNVNGRRASALGTK